MKTLTYAFRFLMRSKSYTLINLLGLAFSLACSIILMRYIHRELTVDTHCVDREQVYNVVITMEGNPSLGCFSNLFYDTVNIDKRHVELKTRYTPLEKDFVFKGDKRFFTRTIVTDSAFFQLFHYPLLQGSIDMSKPESVLLKQDFATRVFGNENPVGKVIRHSNGKDLVVAGILGEPACKTSLDFDIVLSYALSDRWARSSIELYRFMPNTDIEEIKQLGTTPRYINDPKWDSRQYTFTLSPLKETYWDASTSFGEKLMFFYGNKQQLGILTGVCCLLLLTGLLNFINLYLVAMLRRGKEYGLKKIYGASGSKLFVQIWLENILLIAVALLFAWLVIEITQKPVGQLLDTTFPYTPFDGWLSLCILAVVPLVTSVYPFLKYNYDSSIRSIQSIGWSSRSVRTRMSFLAIQYVLTFLLVVASLYFNKQINLFIQTEPGFRTQNILIAKLVYESKDFSSQTEEAYKEGKVRFDLLLNKLDACPFIEGYQSSYETIIGEPYGTTFVNSNGETAFLDVVYASPEFFKIFNIDLEEGSLPEMAGRNSVYALNRSAMKALNFSSLEEAKVVESNRKRQSANASMYSVSAVVKDYYSGHLSEGVRPTLYNVSLMGGEFYQIAYAEGKEQDLLNYLKKTIKEIYGTEDFEYSFLEDDVKALYKEDQKVANVYTLFSLIAIVVSCLGLFGISLFDIRQRYREIAIRKVNGAGLKDLYRLLFKKYLLVLGASFVVATPLAYYLIHRYTADFVLKAPIGFGIFALALALITAITVGTLWWQIRKAASIDPAVVMKIE